MSKCVCGWVVEVFLYVEGQQTEGGPDRLKACEADQLGRRFGERSRHDEGPVRRSKHAEGFVCMLLLRYL